MELKISRLKCKRCGHIWIPRISNIQVCPNKKCHSPKWDVARDTDGKKNKAA
jgi:Zn finger protein HypA/HybF involved in hydrogenase expression